jgi:hypothetical protein
LTRFAGDLRDRIEWDRKLIDTLAPGYAQSREALDQMLDALDHLSGVELFHVGVGQKWGVNLVGADSEMAPWTFETCENLWRQVKSCGVSRFANAIIDDLEMDIARMRKLLLGEIN